MNYWLHPLAERELADAATYYARHASRRIAQAFVDEFERTANLLIENQQLGVMDDADLRVHPLRRFPYSIVYAEANAGPEIYAVAHQRRKPRY